jgi:hypothetical protein
LATLYIFALCGFSVVFLGMLVEALRAVSRKPQWETPRVTLAVVQTVDRRTQNLPFVGVDRRRASAGTAAAQPAPLRKVA